MNTFVTHLESAIDGTRLEADRVQTLHEGRPLWVRYDLDAIRKAVTPAAIAPRGRSLWRACLLPAERSDQGGQGETFSLLSIFSLDDEFAS